MDENNRIIANPSTLQIGFSIFGMFFFSTIAYFIYDSEWIIDEESDNTLIWILISLFCFFALASFYMLLSSKRVELTAETLSITYPYIFQTKIIDFDDVRKVTEGNYNVQSSQDFRKVEIYNGRKITLELFESKKIVITSFEVTNYNLLASNLKNITRSYFKLRIENQNSKSTQGYGWLIFIVILTLGLLISVIGKHNN
ncbi:hypothetical protein LNQ49_02695 [Flavobacterium sp. F-65]|uniref:PH domain-containing protein n=1 Tax=Flavobacterium pisciphilum TaxID=2893755 RepID=A0ABS8MP31_9FLAO|nr:hypothetical protein [Flavobacterium sp. F-65]MCC9070507.1 hypothetical protein [Flavobacterium sp. F-65]